MTANKKQLVNTLMLLLGALIWGTAFVAQSLGSDAMGPFTFLACRSWMAVAFLAVLVLVRRSRGINPAGACGWHRLIKGGLLCGGMLFIGSALQQAGLGGGTSTAKAGFLTALYVLLVPVLGMFVGRKPGLRIWVCVAVSVTGLYLLCMAGKDSGAALLTPSEWMLVLCALLFSIQIMLVGYYGRGADGVALSLAEFVTTAVLSTVCMCLFEHPTLAQVQAALIPILYCGILSSGVAYTLQIITQQALNPTVASLVMCLESVFSALAGWLVLGQSLTSLELLGCVMMFAAIVVAQLPTRKKQSAE